MCEANHQNVFIVKTILRCFELASGLRVNFHKSIIGTIGVERRMMDSFAKTLNCSQMVIPFKYLRLPIGENPRKRQLRIHVIDRIRSKLNVWKGIYLTLADEICLHFYPLILFFFLQNTHLYFSCYH